MRVVKPDITQHDAEPDSRFTEEAKRLLDELVKQEKKALVVVVDPNPTSNPQAVEEFTKEGFVVSSQYNAYAGLEFYQAFKRIDTGNHLVIMAVSGRPYPYDQPGANTKSSVDFAKAVNAIADEHHQPLFIGISTNGSQNIELGNTFPQQYITTHHVGRPEGDFLRKATLDKINQAVVELSKPNPKFLIP